MMFRLPLLAAAFALLFAFPAFAGKSDGPEAQFVQRMGDKALTSLTAKDIPAATRAQRVRSLLRENFDVQTIGRFVMGPAWKEATAAQRTQYMDLFEDMIVDTYSHRFAEYSGQSFEVGTTTPVSGTNDSIVKSKILQQGGPPVLVDWRVRNKNGSMRIVDVVVESISMSMTQRSDFSAVIQSGGVDGLIKSLKKRNGK